MQRSKPNVKLKIVTEQYLGIDSDDLALLTKI